MTFTGSRTSGIGYATATFKDDQGVYGIELSLGYGLSRMILTPSDEPFYHSSVKARELGEAFCHCMSQWNIAQNRERALAMGYGLIG